MKFCDQPDDVRMGVRSIIDRYGGHVSMYQDKGAQVAMPRETWREMDEALASVGFYPLRETDCYFPLGTDSPPDALRWDGGYPGSKGFFRYRTYQEKE